MHQKNKSSLKQIRFNSCSNLSTENSQAITVINPGNPVGAVLDREDVAAWMGLGVVGMGDKNCIAG